MADINTIVTRNNYLENMVAYLGHNNFDKVFAFTEDEALDEFKDHWQYCIDGYLVDDYIEVYEIFDKDNQLIGWDIEASTCQD